MSFRLVANSKISDDFQMRTPEFLKLIIAVVICELAGIVGAFFTASAIPEWYGGLAKPALNPPGWVFGPVWTALYLLMGISVYLIWREGRERREVRFALIAFAIQLILNAIWSPLFFGARSPFLGLIDIILLWLAVLWTMALFFRISKSAGWLLVPYLLWVSFAAYLNFSIWLLN